MVVKEFFGSSSKLEIKSNESILAIKTKFQTGWIHIAVDAVGKPRPSQNLRLGPQESTTLKGLALVQNLVFLVCCLLGQEMARIVSFVGAQQSWPDQAAAKY